MLHKRFFLNVEGEPEKIAVSIEYLLFKHENLSPIPRDHIKIPRVVACSHCTEWVQTVGSLALAGHTVK